MVSLSKSKSKKRGGVDDFKSDAAKARMFLMLACFWPLMIMALFAASAPNQDALKTAPMAVANSDSPPSGSHHENNFNLRNMLDRVDIMGYGPTHPRVAVVIYGEDKIGLVSTVESVFRNTDLNRLFLICVIVDDGHEEDSKLLQDLEQIDAGSVPHWHGLRPDIHMPGSSTTNEEEEDTHERKIHVLSHPVKKGVAASRTEAVEFVQLLQDKHEAAGLKSPQEDLLLLLLDAGVQLTDRKWLAPVTSALIVPPPLLASVQDHSVAMKLANAVNFHLEGPSKVHSFDEKLAPVISDAVVSGRSYPSPAFNGAAMAMRLNTYLNLPAQDESLMEAWPANLELSLNLWLCADGIDMVPDAIVTTFDTDKDPMVPLEPEVAARFAAAWMDDRFAQRFFQTYSSAMTRLEWQTLVSHARDSLSFPKDLPKKCRSFEWFATEINPDFSKVLELPEVPEAAAVAPPKPKEIVPVPVPQKQVVPEEKIERKVEDKNAPPALVNHIPHEEHHEPPPEEQNHMEPPHEPKVESNPNLPQKEQKMPSKPLCKECLEIIKKAKPIDISFVDVSGGNQEFPHKGAKDENGNWGYIHDETALHKTHPPFQWEETEQKTMCMKRDNNYKMLTERVFVDLEYEKKQAESGVKRDKIFCLVYTTEAGHTKLPAIRQTWGPKCDGFMVGSTKTDVALGTVEIVHEGPEEYNNIWQKVRSMWSYIYDNYYDKYDWFHIGGDDLFLIVENFRFYLESEEIRTAANGGIYLPDGTETMQTPLFMGRRFAYQGDLDNIFNSGGSGYTMNKAALKALVVDGFPNYFPHAKTFSEDTMVAKIFRTMGVHPYETKDENGGERYMPFMPGHHWGYRMPADIEKSKDWYAHYSINIKEGPDHCSPRSIAFHYAKGDMMKLLFALLYHLCPKEFLGDKDSTS